MSHPVTLHDIQQARQRIYCIANHTPVLTSRVLDSLVGKRLFFKCEPFQRGGSFKIRGAANFVYSIPQEDRARGVVAFSSGNHAQAVAIAAESVQIPATIVMPLDAPRSKREATESRGARVIAYDRFRENREQIARQVAEQTGATLIPPFDHPWIMAGAGTTGLELMEDIPDLDTIVVCLGGGGLLSGSAIAAKSLDVKVRLFGVEPEAGNDYVQSLQAGHPITIPAPDTIADGLRTTRPGDFTFPVIRDLVEDVLTVTDEELLQSMRLILSRLKVVVEPSGAAAAAAVLCGRLPAECRRVGITLSGGNVDFDMLQRL